jgi:hypothetical protein
MAYGEEVVLPHSIDLILIATIALSVSPADAADFLFLSSNQKFDVLDCEKKGFDGLIVSGEISLAPRTDKAIQITCGIIRFELGSRLSVAADLLMKAPVRLEGPVEIVANAPPPLTRVIITKPISADADGGDKGNSGRNLRGQNICSATFAKASDAERMNGERGEDGDHGLPGRDGAAGSNGNPGYAVTLVIGGFRSDTKVRITSRGSDGLNGENGGRGQNGGRGGDGGSGASARPPLPCRSADNGGNGGDGGHGGNAGRGGNGGNGGRGGRGGAITVVVRTDVAPPKRFLAMDNLGGKGGRGGKPNSAGEIGKGGAGGRAGHGGLAFLVRSAGEDGRKGNDGSDGQLASDGLPGADGRAGMWGEADASVAK